MANPYAHHISNTGGGNGSWYENSDVLNEIPIPSLSVLNGFTHTYNVTIGTVRNVTNYMWNLWTSLERQLTKADDCLISLTMLPLPSSFISHDDVNNDSYVITAGYLSLPYNGLLITKGLALDCGRVTINEYSGSFLDYDENTQISLYLPYIGSVELDPQLVMNKDLRLVYTIDPFTGNCVANVYVGSIGAADSNLNLMYTFNGNCGYQIPMSSGNYSDMILEVIGMAAKIVAAVI